MLVFHMDKSHDPVHNSAPTKTAQSSCFQLDSYSQAWTPFLKMARLCHDTTWLPPFLTFAHIPCQTSGEGGEVTHTGDSSWSDISRPASSVCGSGFIGPSAAKPSTSDNVTPCMPQQRSDTRARGWSSCVFYCTAGVWSKCTFLLAGPQSGVISETTHQILTFGN